MALIKHVAICTNKLEETRDYYRDVFGLELVREGAIEGSRYAYMTDGHVNLALLDYTTEECARNFGVPGGKDWVGIQHIGFMVDEPDAFVQQLMANGARAVDAADPQTHTPSSDVRIVPNVDETPNIEYKFVDPNGIMLDVAPSWPGVDGH